MNLRFLSIRVPALCVFCAATLLFPIPGAAQNQPAPQNAPPPAPNGGKSPAQPDYPDPRTLTVGVWYWLTVPGTGPDIRGGNAATGYESLYALGKDHASPGVEASYPITRTGELRFEGFESKGTGSQSAPSDTTVFATAYSKGDYLATQYQIRAGKLYLEDLLHPFKFPVSKFRLKSLWEVQYIDVKTTIDAPLKNITTDSSGNLITNTAMGTRSIIFPTFGLAAEYAISPHILLRAAASGFGLPHKADIWDAEATISYRHGKWEVLGGAKALHFKTSPQNDEYIAGTLDGGYVGVRWHF